MYHAKSAYGVRFSAADADIPERIDRAAAARGLSRGAFVARLVRLWEGLQAGEDGAELMEWLGLQPYQERGRQYRQDVSNG